jgi:hypothetical protein
MIKVILIRVKLTLEILEMISKEVRRIPVLIIFIERSSKISTLMNEL